MIVGFYLEEPPDELLGNNIYAQFIHLFLFIIYLNNLNNKQTLFHVGGGKKLPSHHFFLNNIFCKNRIDLKILDFVSYTYMHPIELKKYKIFHYSSVDNLPKLTEIGKNG